MFNVVLIFILDIVYYYSLKNSIFFHFYINFNCNRVKRPRHSPRNIETGSNELIEVLIHGEINFSLLGLTDPNMAFGIDTQVIAHYPLRIIVAKTHPWANRSGVYFRELANQNFIGLSSNYLHNQILQQLIKQNQIGLNTIYRSPAVAVVKALVAKNLGVSYLTSLAINDDDQVVALPLLDANQPDFILAAATRQNHLMTAKEELLWEILTKHKQN